MKKITRINFKVKMILRLHLKIRSFKSFEKILFELQHKTLTYLMVVYSVEPSPFGEFTNVH